jgi:hypothetical protein
VPFAEAVEVGRLAVGDVVRVSHQYRSTVTGVVQGLVVGGFYLVLWEPCHTRMGDYPAGYRLVYNVMRVRSVERAVQ